MKYHKNKTIDNKRVNTLVKRLIADGYIKNQTEFAQIMGYTVVSLSHIVNGHREVSRPFLDKLFTNFPNVSEKWLLTGDGDIFTTTTSGNGNIVQAGIGNNLQNADCAEQLKMALTEISEQRKLYASHIDRLLSIIENTQNK